MTGLRKFFPADLPPGKTGDPGIFGPESAVWRIARERAVLAGGPAALLLQVAHPLVAEGVKAHSGFATDPLERLRGTLDAVLTVTFGDQPQVRGAADHVMRKHRPVRGTLPRPAGSLPAGTPYSANDPELALWVFATLVWTAIEVTETFLRPVTGEERDAYYQDMTQMAYLFGVPDGFLPDDYPGLERYVEQQIRTALDVGEAAQSIARQILTPDPPIVALPLRPLPSVLAAGVLPPALREAYNLRWRRRERAVFAITCRAARVLVPLLPEAARFWPHYLVARERMGQ